MLTIISRFSVYIAALVIFVSWLISNSFVLALGEDTQTMDAVKSERTQARQFADLSDGQRNLLRKIADIEDGLDKLQNERKPGDVEGQVVEDESDGESRWVESFQSDGAQLAQDAEGLGELVERVQPPGDLEQSIKSIIERTKAFDADLQKEANAFEQERKTGPSVGSEQDETNAEGRKKFNEQIRSHLQRIDKMEETFTDLNQQVVSIYAKMDSYVTERRERSNEQATVALYVAYFLYGLGTVIGGLGKWVQNRNRRSFACRNLTTHSTERASDP